MPSRATAQALPRATAQASRTRLFKLASASPRSDGGHVQQKSFTRAAQICLASLPAELTADHGGLSAPR